MKGIAVKLTTAVRNKIATSQFAGPDRSYPIPDRAHAANAKARATQQENAGNLSAEQAARIKAKANRKLGVNRFAKSPNLAGALKV